MKILLIAGHEFLFNPQNGGQKLSFQNYKTLIDIVGEGNVYLCMFSNNTYEALPSNVYVFPTQQSKLELIKNTISMRNVCDKKTEKQELAFIEKLDYDIIYVDSSTIGSWIKKINPKKPVITFFHNVEKKYAWNKVIHENIGFLVAYLSYWYNEKNAIKFSTKIVTLTERDSGLLDKIYGRRADCILPITFKDTYQEEVAEKYKTIHKRLLFIGSLFQPNVDGIKWFVRSVMPEIPEYHLQVVGKGLENQKDILKADNVDVIGTVDNLDEYYYDADAVVIPIFYGDGMKVKTAEALMYGKYIFASDEPLVGYDTKNTDGVYRCNTAREFVESIQKHFSKNNVPKISELNRRLFLEKYESSVSREKLKELIDSIV